MPKIPTCGHPDRKVFSKGDCPQCAQVRYSLERQAREKEKRENGEFPTSVKQISDIKKILDKIYAILCVELKPLHTICEGLGKISGCTHTATEIHHKQGRRGILLIMSKKFSYLCRNCHDFCTVYSSQAQDLGLSLQTNSKVEYDFTERELELIDQFGVRLPKDALHIT